MAGVFLLPLAPSEHVPKAQSFECAEQRMAADAGAGQCRTGQAAQEPGLLARVGQGIGMGMAC